MTLPASGVITWEDICAEFALNAASAVFPTDFYGLGGAPASGILGFQDFYGRSNSPVSVSSLAVASGTATRTITVPNFGINDTAIVFLLLQGSATTVSTASTGWRKIGAAASAGTTKPTTLAIFACENTTVANRPLALTNAGTAAHVQTVYIIKGGGTADDAKDSAPNGAPTQDPGATAGLTASTSWLVIAAATCAASAVTGGPAGFTFNADSWEADANQYAMLTAFQELTGSGATVDPAPFNITQSSTRAVAATLAVNLSLGAGAPATFTPAAGTVSDDNASNANQNSFLTITANKSVTWTWSQTGGTGTATANRVSGASATSIRFDLAPVIGSTKTATISVSAQDSLGNVTNWTVNLTAYQIPAATYTPVAGTYSANNNSNTANPATYTLSANRSVTWTWSRTGDTNGTATIASGGTGTSITFNLPSGASARTSTFTVTANDGYTNSSFTVTLSAAATGVTFTPVAGTYSANDGGASTPVTYTITASAAVVWTWSLSGNGSANVVSGNSATSITLSQSVGSSNRSGTFTVNANGQTWIITLSTTGDGGGGTVMTL